MLLVLFTDNVEVVAHHTKSLRNYRSFIAVSLPLTAAGTCQNEAGEEQAEIAAF